MKNRIHTAPLAFESIFAILMFPDMKHMQQKRRIGLYAINAEPPRRGGSAEAQFSTAYTVNCSSDVFTIQSSRFWDSSSQRAIS